jgi:hypothetical protein
MPITHIIIDTNIIFKDARLSGRELTKLVKTRTLYDFMLCLPMVAYDELIGNFDQDFTSKVIQLEKAIDDINKMVPLQTEINKKTIKNRISKAATKYKERLDKFIKDNKVILLPYPDISHRTVVSRMYEGKTPFGHEKYNEKGYKDFLILQSILEYFNSISTSAKAMLFTANVQDFIGNFKTDKGGIVELETSSAVNFLSVVPSYAALFQKLTGNLKEKHKNSEIFRTNEEISKKIGNAIASDFTYFDSDILGGFMWNLDVKDLSCNVKEYAVVVDEDVEVMEVSGIVKIDISCSFNMDEWDFANLMEPDFVFSDEVKKFVEKKGFSKKDDWTNEFHDMKYSSDFIFNYIDFDFKKGTLSQPLSIDPIFLSLSKI